MTGLFGQVLIGLIAAHLLGDFVLQTREISENKHNWLVLLFHTLLIAAISWLLCGIWNNCLIPAGVFVMHTLLDYVKSRFLKNNLTVFMIDQSLHIIFLFALALWVSKLDAGASLFWFNTLGIVYVKILIVVSGFIIAVRMNAFIIQFVVAPLRAQLKSARDNTEKGLLTGLLHDGLWIGQFERALIMLLYLTGLGAGIGFLMVAKAVLCYLKLRSNPDKMRARYIIIGALLSFSLGIVMAVVTKYVLGRV